MSLIFIYFNFPSLQNNLKNVQEAFLLSCTKRLALKKERHKNKGYIYIKPNKISGA